MNLIHKHVHADGDVPREGDRDTASRSTRVSRARVRPQSDEGSRTSGAAAVGAGRQRVAAPLVVRWGRRRTAVITWLSGALDQATAAMLDREIDAHPTGTMRFIVDRTLTSRSRWRALMSVTHVQVIGPGSLNSLPAALR
jgi:hypothetical protein